MTRRPRPLLRAALSTVALLLPAIASTGPSALAQEDTRGPTLTLLAQSPWNTPADDVFDLKALITNTGNSDLTDVSIRSTLYEALPNRGEYQASLTQSPSTLPLQEPRISDVGSIEAGGTVAVRYRTDLGFLAERSAEGRLYPVTMELMEGEAVITTLRTSAIFITETPKEPLLLTWTFELTHPTVYDPIDEVFTDRSLERSIGEDGWLGPTIASLNTRTRPGSGDPAAIDVAVSVPLTTQLMHMSSGYVVRVGGHSTQETVDSPGAINARRVLDELRGLGEHEGVQISAEPFGTPNLPRLATSGLGADIEVQISRGNQEIAGFLGVPTTPTVLVPPGSAIDERTLVRADELGIKVMPLSPGTIEQAPQDKGFAPSPVTLLPPSGRGHIIGLVPDPGVTSVMEAGGNADTDVTDPRLAAQQALGDLAAIWLEDPATERGVALFAGPDAIPAGTLSQMIRLTTTAPWLDPTHARTLAARIPPANGRAAISWAHPPVIPASYIASINRDRALIEAYRSTATTRSQRYQADGWDLLVLRSEENALINSDLGQRWLGQPLDEISAVFSAIRSDSQQVFTLTARDGTLPVRITNTSGERLTVDVQLEATRVKLTGENPQRITIGDDPVVLSFPVQAQTTGQIPVRVVVSAPDGTIMSQSTITVRSTAYSRVALILMAAAIVALALMWAKRLVATRRPPHE